MREVCHEKWERQMIVCWRGWYACSSPVGPLIEKSSACSLPLSREGDIEFTWPVLGRDCDSTQLRQESFASVKACRVKYSMEPSSREGVRMYRARWEATSRKDRYIHVLDVPRDVVTGRSATRRNYEYHRHVEDTRYVEKSTRVTEINESNGIWRESREKWK